MNNEAIFTEALAIASPTERAAFLDKVCAEDAERRKLIEGLLQAHENPDSFLNLTYASVELTRDVPPSIRPGTVIGPYRLLQQIGEGGMGTVYMAEQTQPVQRKVALKIIKAGMDSKQIIARFEAERQALALMDHPNIAKVFDAGTTENGRPYFVMELVKGEAITKYCDEHRLTPRQRLELFLPICQAIQHAHQKGIIHRDIKASNVLIAPYDGKPVVKVIDFGIAKATGQKLTDKTLFTDFGAVVGTLEYMSPEQAELNNQDIDTRSDIYSLGVLLYELLTGTTPLDRVRLKKSAFAEVLRMIREDEPPRPSARLSNSKETLASISGQRQMEPAKLTNLMRGELDWIVMKALDKDRNRRYETANDFAMDVQRYLVDEPVQACPPSATYRLRKFARRNRADLAIAGLILFFLVLLGGGAGWVVGDRSARQADAEERVREALAAADPRLREGNPHDLQLVSAARRAEAQLASGVLPMELQQEVEQLLADLKMLETLEQIRLEQAAVKGESFDIKGADASYRKAFQAYRIDVDVLDSQHVGAKIRASAIAVHLAAALDNWAWAREGRERTRFLDLALAGDPDALHMTFRQALARNASIAELDKLLASSRIQELPATTLVLLAELLQGREAIPLKVDVLLKAQQKYPSDFWINQNLAVALQTAQPPRLDEAIGYFRVAIALRPESPGVYLSFGNALRGQGKLAEALVAFKQALRLKPDYGGVYLVIGKTFSEQGKSEEATAAFLEAIAACRAAVRLDPNAAAPHNSLGLALVGAGRLDEAIEAFKEVIRLEPLTGDGHSNLGAALTTKGELSDALAACREAVRLDRKGFSYHINLGRVCYRMRLIDEAIAADQVAVNLDNNSPIGHASLGAALAEKGNYLDAVAAIKKAHELALNHPALAEKTASLLKRVEQRQMVHNQAEKLSKTGQAQEFKGELTKTTPLLQGKPFKTYPLSLKAGKNYLIDLKSTDFDAYLMIKNPDREVIAEDDDGGGFTDSRVLFVAKTDGQHEIVVQAIKAGQTGNYTLRIQAYHAADAGN